MWGNSVKGPDVEDLKVTIENLSVILSEDQYVDGMDQSTTIRMVRNLYSYVVGDLKYGLQIPAPAYDPDDKHKIMWPEGMKVKSRRGSVASNGSGRYVKTDKHGNILSPGNVTGPSRASSATSTSKYSSRYVGIAEEEEDDPRLLGQPAQRREEPRKYMSQQYVEHNDPERHGVQQSVGRDHLKKRVSYGHNNGTHDLPVRSHLRGKVTAGTHRVSDAAMKPTASMERFIGDDDQNEVWEEPEVERHPAPKSKPVPKKKQSNFADDE